MSEDRKTPKHRAVPSSRISRLSGFGRLAGGIAGGMMAEGVRRLSTGELPKLEDMLLTPGNALRLADRLSHLRGAAMKLGQMISMDAGDILPPELSNILAGLRDRANFMPPRQLNQMLKSQWGEDWRSQFAHFEARPIAAASIGQVHKATTHDGRVLAIKVQYPGIRESIDADVDNVATLLKMSTMLPPQLDLAPLLEAAKAQLHEEADYQREGEQMQRYAALLADEDGFVVPLLDEELTRDRVIAMSFEPGVPIESIETESQELRDDVTARVIELVSRELFEFGFMQTDPNFANYRYQPDTKKIVLLDFGATRPVPSAISMSYRNLIEAGLNGEMDEVIQASVDAGFVNPVAVMKHRDGIEFMTQVILDEFTREGPFDFGDRAFVGVLRDEGMRIAADREAWHMPPAETLFVQRKVSGTALLGARLKAVVDVRGIITRQLSNQP
ncbi:AarF/ABC1/UbiB kinase family protein [Altererythrobacter luteolus]|uniref:AarF/ABC1/UbiB kinase family protein n=1 Tax=Pontixanthobacter luteolus TaxID=295089 RepID=A0A6I4V0L5_9SPHN|nr:AarF/ABC1/UbiB kinase family protein [Pontixanthobacter luteolus]MXP46801.1 AarF/ABC1/UbiB kinase family protein [Pontixanthobacter luteolus]